MLSADHLEGVLLQESYLIQERVSKGGMAWVYRATHKKLGGQVAVKVLFPHLASQEKLRQRFLREARIQYNLHHPHIVRVFDLIEEQGIVGFVMEWCDGGSLQHMRKALGGQLTPAQIAKLYPPILEAIGYAHANNIIHRDIKPSNILLFQEEENTVPKVSDFGIAKVLEEEGGTKTGAILGTPGFMAPEQLQGQSHQVDVRSDIYSLGAMLYLLAAGTLPFAGNAQQVLLQLMTQEPSPPQSAHPEFHPLLLRWIANEPKQRPSSCNECMEELQAVLQAIPKPQQGESSTSYFLVSTAAEAPPLPSPASSQPKNEASVQHPSDTTLKPFGLRYCLWLVVLVVMGVGVFWIWPSRKNTTQPSKRTTKEVSPRRPPIRRAVSPKLAPKKQLVSKPTNPWKLYPTQVTSMELAFVGYRMRSYSKDEMRRYLLEACKRNVALGCHFLGERLRKYEPKKSASWYQKGCQLRHAKACFGLGTLLFYKDGMYQKTHDTRRGCAYLALSCTLNFKNGCYLKKHRCRSVTYKSLKVPKKVTTRSGRFSFPLSSVAILSLARHRLRHGLKKDAQRLLGQNCKNGHPAECYLAGYRLWHKEQKKALFYMQRGCLLGDAMSCEQLGIIYKGVSPFGAYRNRSKSCSAFQKACRLGREWSCSKHKQLCFKAIPPR